MKPLTQLKCKLNNQVYLAFETRNSQDHMKAKKNNLDKT